MMKLPVPSLQVIAAALLAAPVGTITGQEVWQVDATPLLDVPGLTANGIVNFGYAAGATRLLDGTILIADRAENSVRVIDANGQLLRSVGRAGDGPGEFRSMIWAGGCGTDSLLIWDMDRRRADLIGPDGGVARQFEVPKGDTAQIPFQFSCGRGGSMAYQSIPRPSRGGPPAEDPNIVAVTAALYGLNEDGTIKQRFGEIAAGEMLAITSPNGGHGSAPRPLGRNASVAVIGNDVVIGSADSALATVVAPNGEKHQIRFPSSPRAPTRAEFETAVQATASMIPPPIRSEMMTQLLATPMPDKIPAISALFGDPNGLLWVQVSPSGGESLEFLVLQLDGKLVAKVRVPGSLTVFEIGRDYILGSYSDAEDEMHVAAYKLHRD